MIYFSTVSQSLKRSFNFGLLTTAIGTDDMQMGMHNIFLEYCLAVVFRYNLTMSIRTVALWHQISFSVTHIP